VLSSGGPGENRRAFGTLSMATGPAQA